jgi:flavin reductase (DIM6/NTAB) family NADH-FMN oxidoreductase RutF
VSISSETYRHALRLFPSGVTVVTIRSGEVVHGLTVSAFASVSPEPPLVSVIIDHRHKGHELLEQPGARFAVNFLAADQEELSNRFAWTKDEERFEVGDWEFPATTAPILRDALAWLDCRVHSRLTAAKHTVYIGEVENSFGRDGDDALPLVYWNRGYRHLRR